jgi:hypothetical protein
LVKKLFNGDPDYKKIKRELEPFITKITKVTGKSKLEYKLFKKNVEEWRKRFHNTVLLMGMVDEVQKFQIPLMQQVKEKPEKRRLVNVLDLFRYLGFIESIGTSLLDMLILLLVANGHVLHVERVHEVPRIVHAKDFTDLRDVSLASKINFLKRNGCSESAKLIDRKLRNAIAHLNFKIDSKGNILIPAKKGRWKTVKVYEKINFFIRRYMMITWLFTDEGLHKV